MRRTSTSESAGCRQAGIYARGCSARRPRVPDQLAGSRSARPAQVVPAGLRLRRRWRRLRAHRCGPTGTAFERRQLVPRMLRDVSVRDTSVELFGRRLPAPLLLAPIGALGILHPEADVAVAKAAAEHGVPFIFSNQASRPMEDCAAVMGDAPRWFQLYWSTSDDLVASLVGAGGGGGLRRHRGHPGHHDAGLAAARPGSRLPAVRAG